MARLAGSSMEDSNTLNNFICYKFAFLGANLNRYSGRGRYLNDLVLWHFSQALPKLPLCASSFAWQP